MDKGDSMNAFLLPKPNLDKMIQMNFHTKGFDGEITKLTLSLLAVNFEDRYDLCEQFGSR